jgi:hypothetical protein
LLFGKRNPPLAARDECNPKNKMRINFNHQSFSIIGVLGHHYCALGEGQSTVGRIEDQWMDRPDSYWLAAEIALFLYPLRGEEGRISDLNRFWR